MALFLGLYGSLCFFSSVVFLIWASVAKSRPDLDEETFNIRALEKLASGEEFGNALPVADLIIKHSPRLALPRPVKPSKHRRGRPYASHTPKPRRPKAA
jgi:hypothetical protein